MTKTGIVLNESEVASKDVMKTIAQLTRSTQPYTIWDPDFAAEHHTAIAMCLGVMENAGVVVERVLPPQKDPSALLEKGA